MEKSSAIRIRKPKNNNLQRKRLKVQTTRKEILSQEYNKYKKIDSRFKINLLAITLMSLFVMGFLLFNTRSKLIKAKNEYNNLDSQYISYQLTKDRLNTKLEKSIDLDEIQRYAREDLNMVYANDDNTVYINVNR